MGRTPNDTLAAGYAQLAHNRRTEIFYPDGFYRTAADTLIAVMAFYFFCIYR